MLEELKQAAFSARTPGTVWMLTATAQHLGQLQAMGSPAFRLLYKWQPFKRFSPVDAERASSDLVLTAVSPPSKSGGAMGCRRLCLPYCLSLQSWLLQKVVFIADANVRGTACKEVISSTKWFAYTQQTQRSLEACTCWKIGLTS